MKILDKMTRTYQIVKWSVAESVPDRASVHTRTLLSKQFLLRNSTAPLRYWKWNVPYRIGFWTGPSQVWTLLSEQKLPRNLVLVNDLFKSKGSVTNCITDKASVHTGHASEQFLHRNRTLILCSHCTRATFATEQKPNRYSVNIA